MKLSEAIRCGADVVQEVHGVTLQIPGDRGFLGNKPCGCAIGTALFSAGVMNVPTMERFDLLVRAFPGIEKLPLCPACDGTRSLYGDNPKKSPGGAIECLFEHHGWSRKAIAEWVEVQENLLAVKLETKEPVRIEECVNCGS